MFILSVRTVVALPLVFVCPKKQYSSFAHVAVLREMSFAFAALLIHCFLLLPFRIYLLKANTNEKGKTTKS